MVWGLFSVLLNLYLLWKRLWFKAIRIMAGFSGHSFFFSCAHSIAAVVFFGFIPVCFQAPLILLNHAFVNISCWSKISSKKNDCLRCVLCFPFMFSSYRFWMGCPEASEPKLGRLLSWTLLELDLMGGSWLSVSLSYLQTPWTPGRRTCRIHPFCIYCSCVGI